MKKINKFFRRVRSIFRLKTRAQRVIKARSVYHNLLNEYMQQGDPAFIIACEADKLHKLAEPYIEKKSDVKLNDFDFVSEEPYMTNVDAFSASTIESPGPGGNSNIDFTPKSFKSKVMYELIDPDFEDSLACCLTHGAIKYGAYSWREVDPMYYFSALQRHLNKSRRAYMNHEVLSQLDKDSGLLHVDHLATNAMFLHYFLQQQSCLLRDTYAKNKQDKLYMKVRKYDGLR